MFASWTSSPSSSLIDYRTVVLCCITFYQMILIVDNIVFGFSVLLGT